MVRFRGLTAGDFEGFDGVIALALAPCGAAFPVEASPKNSDDGKYVFGKLVLGGDGGVDIVCFHDDFCTTSLENVLDEIECEPAEPVSIGNVH